MEWYVYHHNPNAQKIEKWNIFNNWVFDGEVKRLLHKKLSKDEFAENLRKLLLYYFWSKCEYEVIISPWVGNGDEVKIDIYDQVMLNFDRFVHYVWSFRKIKTK